MDAMMTIRRVDVEYGTNSYKMNGYIIAPGRIDVYLTTTAN
jgi:hypothetical protein